MTAASPQTRQTRLLWVLAAVLGILVMHGAASSSASMPADPAADMGSVHTLGRMVEHVAPAQAGGHSGHDDGTCSALACLCLAVLVGLSVAHALSARRARAVWRRVVPRPSSSFVRRDPRPPDLRRLSICRC